MHRGDRVDVETQVDAAHVGGRPENLDRLGRQIGEIDVLGLERELPGLDLRDEEEVAHEPQEPVRVAVHDVEEAPVLERKLGIVEDELQVAGDRRQRRAQLVRDERDELIFETVELAQPVVLLQEQPLGRLGFGERRALALVQAPALLTRLLELANEPVEPQEDEQRQDRGADEDDDDAVVVPGEHLDGQHRRPSHGGERERAETPGGQTLRSRGGCGQGGHGRVESRSPDRHVAEQPHAVDPGSRGLAGDLEAQERDVRGDVEGHPEGQQPDRGRATAGREEQTDEQRQQENVHEGVRGREHTVQNRQALVGDVREHEERPADGERADGDDRCVEEARAPLPAVCSPVAGEEQEPGGEERVAREVEEIGDGRERILPQPVRVDVPGDLARDEGGEAGREEEPRQGPCGTVDPDAHEDRDDRRAGDHVVHDGALQVVGQRQIDGDRKQARHRIEQRQPRSPRHRRPDGPHPVIPSA